MVLIFNIFVIIFSDQSSRGQSLNIFDDLWLILNNIIGDSLSSFVLYLIDCVAKDIGDMGATVHHLLMPSFIIQIHAVGIWMWLRFRTTDACLLIFFINKMLLL